MINKIRIEHGFMDDMHPTYVSYEDGTNASDEMIDIIFNVHPLTKYSINIFELCNLCERIIETISNTQATTPFAKYRIKKLEQYKEKIIEIITILENKGEPVRDDDECFKGELKIPKYKGKKIIEINTFPEKKDQVLALRKVNKFYKKHNTENK